MIAVQFVYHPAYGLPDDTRCQVLADSENYKLAFQTIYRWRKEMFVKPAKETANG